MQAPQPLTGNPCLRRQDAARYVGLSATTVMRYRREGAFVPEVRLTRVAVGFLRADLDAWLDARRLELEGRTA